MLRTMLRIMFKVSSLSLILIFAGQSTLHACNVEIYANENMKPKVYQENGQAKGILVEMMNYVGDDIGCQFNFHFSTWARAYKSMQEGKGGVIGLSKNKLREEIIDYSDVMYMEDIILITHINSPFRYSSITDLSGKTVSYSRNATLGDEFDQAAAKGTITFVGDNGIVPKRIERVAKKRLDVAAISPGKYAFNNAFIQSPELLKLKDQLYIVPGVFKQEPNFLGFSKNTDNKAFLEKFNSSMKKGKKSGAFQTIEDKYHSLQE